MDGLYLPKHRHIVSSERPLYVSSSSCSRGRWYPTSPVPHCQVSGDIDWH